MREFDSYEIIDAILVLHPGALVTITDADFEKIQWHNIDKPIDKDVIIEEIYRQRLNRSQAEAEAAVKKLAAEAKLIALGLTTDDLKALGLV